METLPFSSKITFNNIGVKPGIKKTGIKNWLLNVCSLEQKSLLHLNYTFCDDEYLLAINKQHLKHDYYTDIITFDLSDNKDDIEGDIYISIERVKDNARQGGNTFDNELRRVLVHGLLHLCGYNDKTKRQVEKMRAKENTYLGVFDTCST